jgi:hypothetical protein
MNTLFFNEKGRRKGDIDYIPQKQEKPDIIFLLITRLIPITGRVIKQKSRTLEVTPENKISRYGIYKITSVIDNQYQ